MKLTTEGIKLLKSLEGSVKRGGRHVVYDDGTGAPFDEDRIVGQATIGHGHLLVSGESFPDGLSETEATALLKADLTRFEKTADELIAVPIEPHERDAFVSVAQTKVFITCRIAFGGNAKRQKRLGEEAVAKAGKDCTDNFDALNSWWFVFVKLSDAYDKLEAQGGQ